MCCGPGRCGERDRAEHLTKASVQAAVPVGKAASTKKKQKTKMVKLRERFMRRDCNRFLLQILGERYFSVRDGISAMEI